MNKSSSCLNVSSSSNSVLLIFTLFVIFLLSSSNISVTGSFENSLSWNSFENFFQGISFLLIRLGWSEINNFSFFSLSKRLLSSSVETILYGSWWVVNKTSRFLNPSCNSDFVLFVLRLFVIFLLGSSDISITGSFENSLSWNSFEYFFQGISFLFVRLGWSKWNWFFSLSKRLFLSSSK